MVETVLEFGALALTLVFFGVIYFLDKKKNTDFGILTLIGTAFGILVGIAFKGHYSYVAVFGSIYANVISAMVFPLILFSIVSSITNLGQSIKIRRIGLKTVFYLLLNNVTASTLTLLFAVGLGIGNGFRYTPVTEYKAKEVPAFLDTLVGLFPQNLASQWAAGSVIPLVIFAVIVAVAFNRAVSQKQNVEPFKKFVDAGNAVMGQAIAWLIGFTPYAVLSLIARAVSRSSLTELAPLLGVLALAYVLCAIQLFGVESIFLRLIGKLNPVSFFKGIWPAGVVAFTSQSSVGTIPVTVRQLTDKLGVNEDVASFGATLGANLGMPGCAGIWPTLLAVFTIHVLGISYTPLQYVSLILLALVVSVGTVGVPGTATITATAVFTAAGLPVEMIFLLTPISTIVDMARTATNVVGAATASVLVAKREGLLNENTYENAGRRTEKVPAQKPAIS